MAAPPWVDDMKQAFEIEGDATETKNVKPTKRQNQWECPALSAKCVSLVILLAVIVLMTMFPYLDQLQAAGHRRESELNYLHEINDPRNRTEFLPSELQYKDCNVGRVKKIINQEYERMLKIKMPASHNWIEWDWAKEGTRLKYWKYAQAVEKSGDALLNECGNELNQQEPRQGSVWDDLDLQIGWVFYTVGFVLLVLVWRRLVKAARWVDGPHVQYDDVHESCAMALLSGKTLVGKSLNVAIIAVSLVNFVVFAQMTEVVKVGNAEYRFLSIDIGEPVQLHYWVENISYAFFAVVTILRMVFIYGHPFWGRFGRLAPLHYLAGNAVIQVEIAALAITVIDLTRTGDARDFNFLFLFCARVFDMIENLSSGRVLTRLGKALEKDGWRLGIAFIINFCVLFTLAGLFYAANSRNYPTDHDAPDNAIWHEWHFKAALDEEPRGWRKFQSIPSSMFFVMQNLSKELPLANSHVFWSQRFVVSLIVFCVLPVFAVPVGIIERTFFNLKDPEEDDIKSSPTSRSEGDHTQGRQNDLWKAIVTLILAMIPISLHMDLSMEGTDRESHRIMNVSPETLALWDLIASVAFCFEMIVDLPRGLPYIISFDFVVDVMAFLPGFLHAYEVGFFRKHDDEARASNLILICMVLRLLKVERYFGAFRMAFAVYAQYGGLMVIGLLFSGVVWMMFTVLFYKAEQGNPTQMHQENYQSIMRSGWAEIIQLHGEYPWADYMPISRALCVASTFFANAVFCIPISLAVACSQVFLSRESKSNRDDKYAEPWPKGQVFDHDSETTKVSYRLLYAHLLDDARAKKDRRYKFIKWVTVILSILVVCVGIIGTVEVTKLDNLLWEGSYELFYAVGVVIDVVSVGWFSAMLALQMRCLGITHLITLPGLCDILSLAAIVLSLSGRREEHLLLRYPVGSGHFVREIAALRACRLTACDCYVHARHVLFRIVARNRARFLKTTFAFFTFWMIHGHLLYLFENGNRTSASPNVSDFQAVKGARWANSLPDRDEFALNVLKALREPHDSGEVTMAERYSSMPAALQYSILHMFGDFPISDYTFSSKVIHWIGVLIGMAMCGTYIGFFGAGYIQQVGRGKRDELHVALTVRIFKLEHSLLKIQRFVRKWLRRRREGQPARHTPRVVDTGFVRLCKETHGRYTPAGRKMALVLNTNMLFSVILVFVSTIAFLKHRWNPRCMTFLLVLELISTLLFTFDFAVLRVARPSWLKTLFALACLWPGYAKVISGFWRPDSVFFIVSEGLLAIRVFNLLRFRSIASEVRSIRLCLTEAFTVLGVPAFVTMNCWLWLAILFHWTENRWKNESVSYLEFRDLPDAFYWTSAFCVGEWPLFDFSFMGSILAMSTILIFIALVGIPFGVIMDSVAAGHNRVQIEEKVMTAFYNGCDPRQILVDLKLDVGAQEKHQTETQIYFGEVLLV